jgi:hypothetical protein
VSANRRTDRQTETRYYDQYNYSEKCFFFKSSRDIWPNDLSVNWCSVTRINISDALNHNSEQNYCPKLFIYTLRDLQIVSYIALFKKIQPSYHTVSFIIVPTKATYRTMSSTRWIQSPPSDPTMLESHLTLRRSSGFLHFRYKYSLFHPVYPRWFSLFFYCLVTVFNIQVFGKSAFAF